MIEVVGRVWVMEMDGGDGWWRGCGEVVRGGGEVVGSWWLMGMDVGEVVGGGGEVLGR